MARWVRRRQECRPQAGQRELAISRSAELGRRPEFRREQRMVWWPGPLLALSPVRRQFPRWRVGLVSAASASHAPTSRWRGRRRVRFPSRRRAWCAEMNLEPGGWWVVEVARSSVRAAEGAPDPSLQMPSMGAAGVAASRVAGQTIAPANQPASSPPSLPSRPAWRSSARPFRPGLSARAAKVAHETLHLARNTTARSRHTSQSPSPSASG